MMKYLIDLIGIKNIVLYIFIINILGLLAMGLDKLKAKHGSWRIPENTLFMFTILGGGIGTIAGIYLFRHKTRKLKFTIGMPLILILEIIIIVYFSLGK